MEHRTIEAASQLVQIEVIDTGDIHPTKPQVFDSASALFASSCPSQLFPVSVVRGEKPTTALSGISWMLVGCGPGKATEYTL
jgi:hypothetical protein